MTKRSCRRSFDENKIHDKAVKMRKMTDKQLVEYVENRVEKARSEGMHKGKEKALEQERKSAKDFLAHLQTTKIPGIGAVTINKLLKVAKEHGYIQ